MKFHELLSSQVRCNAVVVALGCSLDAKSGMIYLAKYISKNPVELVECVPLLIAARNLAPQYGSVVEDAGSPERDAKFLFAKLLNKHSSLQKYSLEQSAAAALRIPSSYSTDETVLLFAWGAAAALRNLQEEREIDDDGCGAGDDDSEGDEGDGDGDEGDDDASGPGIGDDSDDHVSSGVDRISVLAESVGVDMSEDDGEEDVMGEAVTGIAADVGDASHTTGRDVWFVHNDEWATVARRVQQSHEYFYRGPLLSELYMY